MSGKIYTMKELKSIVVYLTEHKAYGEVRGRKMWVDFANSQLTTRTWQSLKETFLKRILPDIHNPYYNLTREQIISFRQGYDVDERDKNKLEIEVVAEIHKDIISSVDVGVKQGEPDKCSNITSKDIPEHNNCYNTVDDIRRDLESPKVVDENKSNHSKLEKMPPVLQRVLNDFASDSEDAPGKNEDATNVKIQEETDSAQLQNNEADKTIPDIDKVHNLTSSDVVNVKQENSIEEPSQSNSTENETTKIQNGDIVATETGNTKAVEKETSHDILEISSTNDKDCDKTSNKKNENQENVITSMTSSCQPLTNSTSETILPNNQEGLQVQTQKNTNTNNAVESKNSSTKPLRKRSSSAETVLLENKRQKINSTLNTSEKNCEPKENDCDPEIFNVIDSDEVEGTVTNTHGEKGQIIDVNSSKSDDEEPQTENPCLKSVSLFAEQFNKTKYADSTSDENPEIVVDPKPSSSKAVYKGSRKTKDEVLKLKSHSESGSDEKPKEKKRDISKRVQAQRNKALANIFGFNSGAVSSSRNRKSSQNRPRRHHNTQHVKDQTDSCSSEWTTETEQDDFVLPPRGRSNRKTRRYLKPKSARILSLEEEGGLFVMYGKRIYPVVKDGRIVKNYVIYESNSDSGFEQDSYWKAKYAELKKKYEENKKNKERERSHEKRQRSVTIEPSSPILQSSTRKQPLPAQTRDEISPQPSTSKTNPVIENKEIVTTCPVENKMSSEKIMIKYTINNAEVQLEGHWPQICPIFDKVLDILPRKTDPQLEAAKSNTLDVQEVPKVISSGESTPIIIAGDMVQEKIDALESEIFKEIEEKHMEEQMGNDKDEKVDNKHNSNNVTTRKRGRPSKQSTSPEAPKSTDKQLKTSKNEEPLTNTKTSEEAKRSNVAKTVEDSPQITTRRTRQSLKTSGVQKLEESRTRETPKKSNETTDDVRYKIPPNTPNTNKRKPKSFADQIVFQTDDSSIVSESTQGYQDSDISPEKIKKRRKSKLPTVTYRNKVQMKRNRRRRSFPELLENASTDSSNTSFCGSLKSKSSQNSSGIYKSDSYHYLFPNHKKPFNRLEPIDETSPTVNEGEIKRFEAVCRNQFTTETTDSDTFKNCNNEGGSSSNISLPQSPELSVVEDISIGKEFLNSISVYHTLKNTQPNEVTVDEEHNKYIITDVDVTMPLMGQICILEKVKDDAVMKKVENKSYRRKKSSVSESLLNKIGTVNINDNSSVSDSLDLKLRDLLLESAKKMGKSTQSKENMEIDENVINTIQKSKAKKRCSTPRKKKEIKRKLLGTEAAIEEHMETCSYVGRKSCPPSVQVQNENAVSNHEISTEIVQDLKATHKARKKKDVIKVKILRPRNKSVSMENKEKLTSKSSRISICTDSGINGTQSRLSLPISNDSVELIHNHSETCLHANECLDNSVEFIEPSTSFISINSNSMTTECQDSNTYKEAENVSLCSLNNNVKGVPDYNNLQCIKTYNNENKCETIFKSPINNDVLNCSLITEDLSDEAPLQSRVPLHSPGWYFLSEEESTNPNFVSPLVPNTGGFGSNLNQIFPVTCAVPDLSTITEMSKDNDSRKPSGLDSFTIDSNSANIFL